MSKGSSSNATKTSKLVAFAGSMLAAAVMAVTLVAPAAAHANDWGGWGPGKSSHHKHHHHHHNNHHKKHHHHHGDRKHDDYRKYDHWRHDKKDDYKPGSYNSSYQYGQTSYGNNW